LPKIINMIALPTALLLTLAVGALSRLLYLCYFHPLAQYPGPWLARFTNLWYTHTPFLYTPAQN
jgi:hypothetical protein